MDAMTTTMNAEVEGLLNLWDLLHLCAMRPATTSEIMAWVNVTEESVRRLRQRASDKYRVDLKTTEVQRVHRGEDKSVVAYTVDGWGWQEVLDERFAALGA